MIVRSTRSRCSDRGVHDHRNTQYDARLTATMAHIVSIVREPCGTDALAAITAKTLWCHARRSAGVTP